MVFLQQLDYTSQPTWDIPTEANYAPPAVGGAVVRMLHHMSRIFEDNSKADQTLRGFSVSLRLLRVVLTVYSY